MGINIHLSPKELMNDFLNMHIWNYFTNNSMFKCNIYYSSSLNKMDVTVGE